MSNTRILYRWPLERLFRCYDWVSRTLLGKDAPCQWRRRIIWWWPMDEPDILGLLRKLK